MKKHLSSLLLFLILILFNTSNAQIISYKKVDSFSTDSLKKLWKSYKVPKIVSPIKNDVVVYDVVYYTHWVDGSKIKASGLYFAPQNTEDFPVLAYNHGTRIRGKRSNKIRGENDRSSLN